jgi:hypothetical protein
MRAELLAYLKDLSDPAYQQQFWATPSNDPERAFDTLQNTLSEVVDMRGYENDEFIEAAVGGELFDTNEAAALKPLCQIIYKMVKELRKAPAQSYLSDPRWPLVVEHARKAYDLMGDH